MGDKPPKVDDSKWTQEDDDKSVLSFFDGKNWYFLPAQPYVRTVPAGIAAQLRQQGVFGLPATGHSGSAVVSTGHGEAFMIDAGSGVGQAIYNFQLSGIMGQMGVSRIIGIEITHGHKDHVNRIKEVILAHNIPAENIVIADFQAPYASLLPLSAPAGRERGFGY